MSMPAAVEAAFNAIELPLTEEEAFDLLDLYIQTGGDVKADGTPKSLEEIVDDFNEKLAALTEIVKRHQSEAARH